MRHIKVNLKEIYPEILTTDTWLEGIIYTYNYEYPQEFCPAILVIPGGGYDYVSLREKDPVVFSFLARGFHAFSLEYTCKSKYPNPHLQVACAMHYLSTHSDELKILNKEISLVGFSAGGHLVATYSYLFPKFADNEDELKALKPYSVVLCYAVTTFLNNLGHLSTRNNITGGDIDLINLLSVDYKGNITPNYPPTYIWATENDQVVPVTNSKILLNLLIENKVPVSYKFYADGPHGLSVANHSCDTVPEFYNKNVQGWVDDFVDFYDMLKRR